ncbi:MAG: hypothetical protein B6D64_10250 [Bacteroidetes bacterium 4484_276]|nr:MAG: hypothetical protein B6D64_10250 [Bacteroidetes bacterium 4484_276]
MCNLQENCLTALWTRHILEGGKKMNFTRQNGFLLIIAILIVAGFSSCKSNRSLIKAPIKEEGPEYLFERLKENEFRFNTFSAKFNVEYSMGKKMFEFKGQVRIVKDSLIWLTFGQDLGFEMARLLITRDSVKYLDRINKKYFIGDYKFVNEFLKTSIDFGILQSIILGNDFEYYENAKFKASIDGGGYRLTTAGRRKLKKYVRNNADDERIFLQSIWLSPDNFKITQIRIKELTQNSKKLTAKYSGFEEIQGQPFPFKLEYEVETDTPITVGVKYSKIVLNQSLKFPFKIPSKYNPAE